MSGSAEPLISAQRPDVPDDPPVARPDTVTISIVRDPALVRTVRLVAAAVARRAQLEDGSIEEIRLAVGEACAVMIGPDQDVPGSEDAAEDAREASTTSGDQVVVRLSVDGGIQAAVEGRAAQPSTDLAGLDIDPWALLHGLSDEVSVEGGLERTIVRMTWPAGRGVA